MRLEADLEPGPVHRQLAELGDDVGLQLRSGGPSRRGQLGREPGPFRPGRLYRLAELAEPLLGAVETLDLSRAAAGVLEHRLDRAAVLAGQPVEPVEPRLDELEPLGIGLEALEYGAQLAGQVGELDRERRGAVGERGELGVDVAAAGERRLGDGDARAGSTLAVGSGERGERLGEALAQALEAAQPVALGDQALVLRRLGGELLDLGELEAEQVEVALAGPLALAQLGQLALRGADRAVRLGVTVAQRRGGLRRRRRRGSHPEPRSGSACGARAARRRRAAASRRRAGPRRRRRGRRERPSSDRRRRRGGRARSRSHRRAGARATPRARGRRAAPDRGRRRPRPRPPAPPGGRCRCADGRRATGRASARARSCRRPSHP